MEIVPTLWHAIHTTIKLNAHFSLMCHLMQWRLETSQSQPAGCQSSKLRAHIASLERLFTNFCEIKSQRWNQSSQLRLDIPSIPQTWRLMLWTDRKGICYLNLLHLGVLLQLLLTFRCYRGSLFERRRRNISQALSWMQQVTRAWVPKHIESSINIIIIEVQELVHAVRLAYAQA